MLFSKKYKGARFRQRFGPFSILPKLPAGVGDSLPKLPAGVGDSLIFG